MNKIFSSLLILTCALTVRCDYSFTTPSSILNFDELRHPEGLIIADNVDGVSVHWTKGPQNSMQLWWQKGDVSVFMHHIDGVSYNQDWNFGDVHANVTFGEDDAVRTTWNFGDVIAKVERRPAPEGAEGAPETQDHQAAEGAQAVQGPQTAEGTQGVQDTVGDQAPQEVETITWSDPAKKDEEKLEKYRNYITEFCRVNLILVTDRDACDMA